MHLVQTIDNHFSDAYDDDLLLDGWTLQWQIPSRSMGGLCNGKLGEKFNEVFSELMEGDLSKACRYPSILMMKGEGPNPSNCIFKVNSWDHSGGSRLAQCLRSSCSQAAQCLLLPAGINLL